AQEVQGFHATTGNEAGNRGVNFPQGVAEEFAIFKIVVYIQNYHTSGDIILIPTVAISSMYPRKRFLWSNSTSCSPVLRRPLHPQSAGPGECMRRSVDAGARDQVWLFIAERWPSASAIMSKAVARIQL